MLSKLYPYRFELFFFSQIVILFGSLLVPTSLFEVVLAPILFQVNVISGILLVSKKKKLMWFLIVLLIIVSVLYGVNQANENGLAIIDFIQMGGYFLFYLIITCELIFQVWKAKKVNKKVIFGLISGYISLGLIGFFICMSIELSHANSFTNLVVENGMSLTERLMYFSYVTLSTLGYGDIVPKTILAQKAAILISLLGQFYLVILTAVVVGKYINQKNEN